MKLPQITRDWIRGHTTAQSFERGREYSRNGSVVSVVVREGELTARVWGSAFEPYYVEAQLTDHDVNHVYCSCPYDWGGWCKHIVAVLLILMETPEVVEERPSLKSLIGGMNRDQLAGLVLHLAKDIPEFVDGVERYLEGHPTSGTPSVDPQRIRRRVIGILHSLDGMRRSEAYWHVGEVIGQVGSVLQEAWDLMNEGDEESALVVLEAITDEYVKGWTGLDDSDGYAGGFFQELDEAWTNVAWLVEMSEPEREGWARKLEAWQAELDAYGIGVFHEALEALEEG
jgi:uncharacterized Zn finger protein